MKYESRLLILAVIRAMPPKLTSKVRRTSDMGSIDSASSSFFLNVRVSCMEEGKVEEINTYVLAQRAEVGTGLGIKEVKDEGLAALVGAQKGRANQRENLIIHFDK